MLDHLDEANGDEFQRRVAERRQQTYSVQALQRGSTIDRAIVLHHPFQAALTAADRVFQLGRAFTIPAGLRLIGPPGSGKSTLVRYYAESVPRSQLFEPGTGAIAIRLRQRPTLRHAVEDVLRALRYPFPKVTSITVGAKRDTSLDALKQRRTHLLLVDEAHNLCARASGWPTGADEGNDVTEYLREIMDAQVGLILAGGPGLGQLHERDKYLHSRCAAIATFDNFQVDDAWAGVVHGLAAQAQGHSLTFLTETKQIVLLHRATKGNLRALKILIVEAILIACDAGSVVLNSGHMQRAFAIALGGLHAVPNPWGT